MEISGHYPIGVPSSVGEKIEIQITKRGYEPKFCAKLARMMASGNLSLRKPEQTKRVRVPMGFDRNRQEYIQWAKTAPLV